MLSTTSRPRLSGPIPFRHVCFTTSLTTKSRIPFRIYSTIPPSSPSVKDSEKSPQPSTSSKPNADSNASPSSVPTSSLSSDASGQSDNDRLAAVKDALRLWAETGALTIRGRADDYSARAAKTFAQLGKELNKVTGYGDIEILKRRVVEQESRINAARQASREAKEAYEKAVLQRASSQREVNDLLQRKSTWTDEDVSKFTALVRQDHLFEQSETRAKLLASETEAEVEKEFTELMRVILHRYHEEQMWSDKIRSASTYGSLTVLALNLFVFVCATIFVEPWKRRRLAQTFQTKVEEMKEETMSSYESNTKNLVGRLEKQEELIGELMESVQYFARGHHEEGIEEPLSLSGEDRLDQAAKHRQRVDALSAFTPEQLSWIVAVGAASASLLGWFARGWFGR